MQVMKGKHDTYLASYSRSYCSNNSLGITRALINK